MSKVADLKLWASAVENLAQGHTEDALSDLSKISEQSSKIRFNIAVAYERMRLDDQAIQVYTETTVQDEHFAVAYYQRACIHFRNHQYKQALRDFDETFSRMRGRSVIDYNQLGMRHKLHTCDILHNKGLCYLQMNDFTHGMEALLGSKNAKAEARHKHVDAALERLNNNPSNCRDLPLILLPKEAIFKPPRDKIKNMNSINYLGKPKVVTARNEGDTFTGFSGTQLLDIAKQKSPARSAPTSPLPERRHPQYPKAQTYPGKPSTEAQLMSHLHRALSPDRETRPKIMLPNNKAKTPPAKWSPTALQQQAIPPPPRRAIPKPPSPKTQGLQQQQVPVIVVKGSDGAQVERSFGGHKGGENGEMSSGIQNTQKGPPGLPPKNLDTKNGELTSSEGRKAKPPPLVLPSNKQRPPIPVPEGPPPTPERSPLSLTIPKPIAVTMICTGQREVTITQGATLVTVLEHAGKLFELKLGNFDIWAKNSKDEFFMVRSNKYMQKVWEKYTTSELTLWIFAKE